MSTSTHRSYRRSAISWPPTPDQWNDLNAEIDAIYRDLKNIHATSDTITNTITNITNTITTISSITSQAMQGPPGRDGDDGDPGPPGPTGASPGGVVAIIGEVPGGAINSSNTVYTTVNSYQTGTTEVYLNGVRQKLGTDYTETTSTSFTFTAAPVTGDLLTLDYQAQGGGSGSVLLLGNLIAGPAGPPGLAGDDGEPSYVAGPQGLQGVAGASGSLVLLAELTAASSASLNFFTRNVVGQAGNLFQSDYDDYLIDIVGLVPATNSVGIGLRVSTDGSTWISTGTYAWTHNVYGPSGPGQTSNTAQTEIRLIGFVNASNTATFSVNGHVRVFSPLSTALHKVVGGQIFFWDTGPGLVIDDFSGAYSATTAIVGIQAIATSGNLASGTIRVYGIAK